MFNIRLYLFLLISSNGLFSQNFRFNSSDRAQVFFSNDAYANAISALTLSKNDKFNLDSQNNYLLLLSKLRNNEAGSDKQLPFYLERNPISTLGSQLPFDMGNFYFKNKKYSYALKWYRNIRIDQLADWSKDMFYFNKGYSLFHVKRYNAAKPYLEKVKNTNKYQSDAHYYLGHIAYQMEDYEYAQREFSQLSFKTSLQNDLEYFQVDMNFKLGRFKKAIELGNKLLKKSNNPLSSDISKIIGESHFNLKNYKESLPFLIAYDGKNKKWTNADFYQLGYVYYENKKYTEAINQFTKIIDQSNSLSQNAYYHLGDCYLKVEKKIEALGAFKKASEMNFDQNVREDSLLQYAKLGFEIGNSYEPFVDVMIRFLDLFPKNPSSQNIKSLLALSYTRGGNYDLAIKILESKVTFKDNNILQKVLYLKALNLYQNEQYTDTQFFLKKSIKLNRDPIVTARSYLLQGQALFELKLYGPSKLSYDQYYKYTKKFNLNLDINYWYELGYLAYNSKDYDLAIKYFENYLNKEKDLSLDYIEDSYTRLADSYFAVSKYWMALENYNKVISLSKKDLSYVLFQKALSYGFLDKYESKINILSDLISSAQNNLMIEKSLFELAKTYTYLLNFEDAIESYDKLLKNYPGSLFTSRSFLNKGLILFNNDKLIEARSILELTVKNYIGDPVAFQALTTLKEISIETGTVDLFTEWLKKEKINSFSDTEISNSAFESIEKYFFEKDYKQAQKQIKNFLLRYPNHSQSNTLKYYLADIYFQNQKWDNAYSLYIEIIDQPINIFTEKSIVNAVLSLQNLKRSLDAEPLLLRLKKITLIDENRNFSNSNLMSIYMAKEDFSFARNIATEILNQKFIDPKIELDATEVFARSSILLKDTVAAFEKFKLLENSPKLILAAEANYYKAYKFFKNGQHDESNKVIANISLKYGNIGLWSAKSILLMAENFIKLGDNFQSSYVLENLIKNFNEFPEITSDAKKMLDDVNRKISKKNSSITSKETINE